jgi:hypothetical protein
MIGKRLVIAILTGALAGAVLALPVAASNPSCTAQFVSQTARVARPFGQQVVVPEVRNLSLGGPNLGQEVKVVFATADRTACPFAP